MYRCVGREWQEWGWGSTGDGLQYTALLRDSAADQPPPPAAETRPHPSRDEDDDDVMSVTSDGHLDRQQAGRGRKKSCRQGGDGCVLFKCELIASNLKHFPSRVFHNSSDVNPFTTDSVKALHFAILV